jgi:hypothetical protein
VISLFWAAFLALAVFFALVDFSVAAFFAASAARRSFSFLFFSAIFVFAGELLRRVRRFASAPTFPRVWGAIAGDELEGNEVEQKEGGVFK